MSEEDPEKPAWYRPAKPYTVASPRTLASDSNNDPEAQAYRAERRKYNRELRAYKDEAANLAFARLVELVEDADDTVAKAAAVDILNRVDGMPTQKIKNDQPTVGITFTVES